MSRYRVAVAFGVAVLTAVVIGIWIWGHYAPPPPPSNLPIQGKGGIDRWVCEKYSLKITSSNLPTTATVSVADGKPGALYSSERCQAPGKSTVTVQLATGGAELYFRSPETGQTEIIAKAQSGVFSFSGSKGIVIDKPVQFPACNLWKLSDPGSCPTKCVNFNSSPYVDIPYTDKHKGPSGGFWFCCTDDYTPTVTGTSGVCKPLN